MVKKNINREESFIVRLGTWAKGRGMMMGERHNSLCKQNKTVLITRIPIKTELRPTGEYYKINTKNHKKGDPKMKKVVTEWIEVFGDNILDAWATAYEYPTVSYGLTNWKRSVLIVDIDEEFKNLEEAENYIQSRFSLEPSYILQNPRTKHIQFGFALLHPIPTSNFPLFNKLIKRLAKIFNSDSCFNGPACKNPFYTLGFESKITGNYFELTELIDEINLRDPIVEEVKKKSRVIKKIGNPNGWHNTFLREGRNEVFSYFRTFKERFPLEKIDEITDVVARRVESLTNIEYNDVEEAKYQMNSIITWCNDKGWNSFSDGSKSLKATCNNSRFQLRSRARSIQVRHDKKMENVKRFKNWMEENWMLVDLNSKGSVNSNLLSKKKAASCCGLSYDQFRDYCKMIKRGEITIESMDSNSLDSRGTTLRPSSLSLLHNTDPNLIKRQDQESNSYSESDVSSQRLGHSEEKITLELDGNYYSTGEVDEFGDLILYKIEKNSDKKNSYNYWEELTA